MVTSSKGFCHYLLVYTIKGLPSVTLCLLGWQNTVNFYWYEKIFCSLSIVKFQIFLLDWYIFYQSWHKDWCLALRLCLVDQKNALIRTFNKITITSSGNLHYIMGNDFLSTFFFIRIFPNIYFFIIIYIYQILCIVH